MIETATQFMKKIKLFEQDVFVFIFFHLQLALPFRSYIRYLHVSQKTAEDAGKANNVRDLEDFSEEGQTRDT